MGTCSDKKSITARTTSRKTSKNQISEYSRIVDFRKNFEFLSNLGSGSFGLVRLFRSITYKEIKYAIKTIKKNGISLPLYNCIKSEVKFLRLLDHPNIVKYYETFEDDLYIHIVMEYLPGDNLSKIIKLKDVNNFDEKDTAQIIKQLLKALVFIHKRNIVHRDIKPENILFSKKDDYNTLKLIDFGLATTTMQKDKKSCGSLYYMAPEIINRKFCTKTDTWAVGVILYLMLTGKLPFDGKDNDDIIYRIQEKKFNIGLLNKCKCSEEAIDLISGLLRKEIDKRLSSEEALEHPWIEKFAPNNQSQENLSMSTLQKLREFSNKSMFQKEIFFYIAKITKNEEIRTLKEIFESLDKKNRGVLTFKEIEEELRKIDININESELVKIWEGLDFHKDGEVNYTEFLAAMISSVENDREQKLWTAFRYFEEDDDEGYISFDSLIRAAKAFSLNINENEIKKTFDDTDKQGKNIDFETFKTLICD